MLTNIPFLYATSVQVTRWLGRTWKTNDLRNLHLKLATLLSCHWASSSSSSDSTRQSNRSYFAVDFRAPTATIKNIQTSTSNKNGKSGPWKRRAWTCTTPQGNASTLRLVLWTKTLRTKKKTSSVLRSRTAIGEASTEMGDGLMTVAHRSCIRVHVNKVRRRSYFMIAGGVC